ncbi:MAG TPA: hypothetical protein VMI54_02585 [Polyangiaceae bacterium]|nr:hypothetical protein [Polyangiaceae bacterium]
MEPLSDAAVRTLVERYAETVDALEIPAGEPLLVLPNAEFFPDEFTGDVSSVERLAARMQGYAGLERVTVEVAVKGERLLADDACGTGGCGSGACATPAVDFSEPRLRKSDHGWHVSVPASELANPIVLTARLATAFGAVALVERHPDGTALVRDAAEAELAAVALGFGVLLLEASYIYQKGCGGAHVTNATELGCRELSLLFAFAAAREKHSLRAALGELGTTQRAFVKDAAALVAESPGVVKALRESPTRVASGDFKLRDGRSLFARLFSRSTRPQSENERLTAALAALERGASVDELAELVGPADGE